MKKSGILNRAYLSLFVINLIVSMSFCSGASSKTKLAHIPKQRNMQKICKEAARSMRAKRAGSDLLPALGIFLGKMNLRHPAYAHQQR